MIFAKLYLMMCEVRLNKKYVRRTRYFAEFFFACTHKSRKMKIALIIQNVNSKQIPFEWR